MSEFLLIAAAGLTVMEFMLILHSFHPHWFKVCLGYSWVIDLTLGFGLTLMMLSSGALGGIVMSSLTGFCLAISLFTLKRVVGYRKLENGVWCEYAPTMTKESVVKKVKELCAKPLALIS